MKIKARKFRKSWATRVIRVRNNELLVFKSLHSFDPLERLDLARVTSVVAAHDLPKISEKNQMRAFQVEYKGDMNELGEFPTKVKIFITTSVKDKRKWIEGLTARVRHAKANAKVAAEADPDHVVDLIQSGVDLKKLNPDLRARVEATLSSHKWESVYVWVDEFGVEHEIAEDDIDPDRVRVVDKTPMRAHVAYAADDAAPNSDELSHNGDSSMTDPGDYVVDTISEEEDSSHTASRAKLDKSTQSAGTNSSQALSDASEPPTPSRRMAPPILPKSRSASGLANGVTASGHNLAAAELSSSSVSKSDAGSDSDSSSSSSSSSSSGSSSSSSSSSSQAGNRARLDQYQLDIAALRNDEMLIRSDSSYESYEEVWEEWDEWESVSDDSVVHGTSYMTRLLGEHPHASHKVHGGDATERVRSVFRLVDELARIRYGVYDEPARVVQAPLIKARLHGDPLFHHVELPSETKRTYASLVAAILGVFREEAEAEGDSFSMTLDDVYAVVRVDGPDRVRVTRRTLGMLRAGDRLEVVPRESHLAHHYTTTTTTSEKRTAHEARPEGYYRDLWRSIVQKGTWMKLSSWRPSASQRWAQVARAAWKAVAATAWHEISSAVGENLGAVTEETSPMDGASSLEAKMMSSAFGGLDEDGGAAKASPLDNHGLAEARWHEVFAKLESSITGSKKVTPGLGLYKDAFIEKAYEPKPWVDLHESKWKDVYRLLKLAKGQEGLPHSISDSDDDADADAHAAGAEAIVLHDAHEYGEDHHVMGGDAELEEELDGVASDHSDGYFSVVHHVVTKGELHDEDVHGDLRILTPEEKAQAKRILDRWGKSWARTLLSVSFRTTAKVDLLPGSKWGVLRDLGARGILQRLVQAGALDVNPFDSGTGKESVSDADDDDESSS